ncbi:MAG: T9SS type A sorting domain-containing protein [Bacteroidetes bacterium]|nr:T9SS type A sorting domain-containing protein [Bacteroidota bacterium]
MKIKLTLLISIYLLITISLTAQIPNYLWANKAGAACCGDYLFGVCTDNLGNVYITGRGSGSPTMNFGTTTITYGASMYVAKYNATGTLLWVRTGLVSSPSTDEGVSITTDASNNVLIAGLQSSSPLVFGTDTITKTPGAGNAAFLLKYDPSGNVLWVKNTKGLNVQSAAGVATDASNNVYITGWFAGSSASFDAINLSATGPGENCFLAKYDSLGNVIWVRKSSGPGYSARAYGITVGADNNPVITGDLYDSGPVTMNFDTVTISTTSSETVFTAKYDAAGNILWGRGATAGTAASAGAGISSDAANNIYITGKYGYGTSVTFGSTILPCAGNFDFFLTKYDSNGNVLWAKNAGGSEDDRGYSVSSDAAGNTSVTGWFNSNAITMGTSVLTNSGSGITSDIFIAKYNAAGNVTWAENSVGNANDQAWATCIDPLGNTYVGGHFDSPTLTFGSLNLAPYSTSSPNIFLVKIGPDHFEPNGISENGASNDFNIFPNPANGIFSVNSSTKIFQIEVINMLGEDILSEKVNNNSAQVDISSQANGIYFIRLSTEKGRFTQKVNLIK